MAGIITTTIENLDAVLLDFYTSTSAGMSVYITKPFAALAIITIILVGLGFLNGQIEASIKKFFVTCLTVCGVAIFALSATNYNTYIGSYLIKLPDHMMAVTSGLITGGHTLSVTTGAEALDGTLNIIQGGASEIMKEGGIDAFSPYIYGSVFWVVGLIIIVVMFVALVMVKVGVTVVASLGPLFILSLLFNGSREYFTKWLTFASQFIVTGAILGLYLRLSVLLTSTQLSVLAGAIDLQGKLDAIIPLLILLPAIGALFLATTSYASALSGGVAIGIGNALQKITKAGMKGTKGLLSATGNRAVRPLKERREADRSVRMAGARTKARKRANQRQERKDKFKEPNKGAVKK